MLNRVFFKTEYQLARENYLETRRLYKAALNDFELIITGINHGILHGKKEQSLINGVKAAVSKVTITNLEMVKAEHKLNKVARSKWGNK